MSGIQQYIDKICRTCAEEKDNLTGIFENVGTDEILQTMFGVQISIEDTLPKNICYDCTFKLKEVSIFKQNLIMSQEILNQIFVKHEQDIVMVENTQQLELAFAGESSSEESDPIQEITEVQPPPIIIEDSEEEVTVKDEDIADLGESDIDVTSDLSSVNNTSWLQVELDSSEKLIKTPENKSSNYDSKTIRQKILSKKDLGPPYACPVCKKKFRWRGGLLRHITIHDQKRTRRHTCHICSKAFFTSQHRKEHYINVHLKKNQFQCEFCKKMIKRKPDLKRHILRHVDNNKELETKLNVKNTEIPLKQELPLNTDILKWKLIDGNDKESIIDTLLDGYKR